MQTKDSSSPTLSSTKALHAFEHLCRVNSTHGGADEPPRYTHFHAASMPSRNLFDYLGVLGTLCRVGREGIILGIATVYRYCEAVNMMPSLLSAHRLCLTGILLACKAHHDDHMSNQRFAAAGGISATELCNLEWRMAVALGFNLTVSPEDYQLTGNGLRVISPSCTVMPPFRGGSSATRRPSAIEHLMNEHGSPAPTPFPSPQIKHPFFVSEISGAMSRSIHS